MELTDLDRWINAQTAPGAIVLSPEDWRRVADMPEARAMIRYEQAAQRYYYRGLPVLVGLNQPSRVVNAGPQDLDHWSLNGESPTEPPPDPHARTRAKS